MKNTYKKLLQQKSFVILAGALVIVFGLSHTLNVRADTAAGITYFPGGINVGGSQSAGRGMLYVSQPAIAPTDSTVGGSQTMDVFDVIGGNGGDSTSNGSLAVGGNGGGMTFMAGAGGNTIGTPTTGFGGQGGTVEIDGGMGGNGLTAGGPGGSAILHGGQGGTGVTAGVPGYAAIKGGNAPAFGNVNGGDVFLIGGIPNGTGISGNIYLGTSPALVARGNVGIGLVVPPRSLLDVKGGVAIGSYAGSVAAPANSLIISGKLGVGVSAPTAIVTLQGGTTAASTAPLKFTSGVSLTTPEAGAMEYDGTHLYFTNDGIQRQELVQAQQSVTATQFSKAANTTFTDIPNLSATLVDGKTYTFESTLYLTADKVGGGQFRMSGTATAKTIIYEIQEVCDATKLNTITSRGIALNAAAGQAGCLAGMVEMKGTITVMKGGTLMPQFAQNAASGTSSILTGSTFKVEQVQ